MCAIGAGAYSLSTRCRPAQIGDNGHPEDKTTPVIGIAISFPSDSEARTVEYTVNQTYLDEYYGPDD